MSVQLEKAVSAGHFIPHFLNLALVGLRQGRLLDEALMDVLEVLADALRLAENADGVTGYGIQQTGPATEIGKGQH